MNDIVNNNMIETLNKGSSILRKYIDDVEIENFLSIRSLIMKINKMKKNTINNLIQPMENFKSEFLLILEREYLF